MAPIDKILMQDFSNQNLQNKFFRNQDLRGANFSGSDLRGANFSNTDLTGADFTKARTGITPNNTFWLFLTAFIISLASGYFAMLTGHTIQGMMKSPDPNVRNAGIATIVVIAVFILYAYWKGGGDAISTLIFPIMIVAAGIGVIGYAMGAGTGRGMLFMIIAIIFVVVMFVIGTIARTAAGSMSNILFLIVALAGGMFAKSLGGGIGGLIMAIACMQISKRALSGAKGFKVLRRIAGGITKKYGTSFRNSQLKGADFSGSKLCNADFTHSDLTNVNWGDSKKANCIIENNGLTIVKN